MADINGLRVINDSYGYKKGNEILNTANRNMHKNKLLEGKSAKNNIVQNLLNMLGTKSQETKEHAVRMTSLAYKIGKEINLSYSDLDNLSLLATLHDIGKTFISEDILNKPGQLSDEEWHIIKEHPEKGFRIASASEDFNLMAKEILCHHECWDGSGYPQGLKGEDISLLSRIISIVDSYDVMTNERPYSKAMEQEEALNELNRCAGTQFDPNLVEIALKVIKN